MKKRFLQSVNMWKKKDLFRKLFTKYVRRITTIRTAKIKFGVEMTITNVINI